MNIAFLLYAYPGIGGTETVTNTLAEWFTKQDIISHIISWKRSVDESMPAYIQNVLYLPDSNDIDSDFNIKVIEDYIKIHSIDVIINQGPFWLGTQSSRPFPYLNVKIVSVLHYAPTFRIDNAKYMIEKLYRDKNQAIFHKVKTTIRYLFRDYFSRRDFNRVERKRLRNIVNLSDQFVVLCDDYIEELTELLSIPSSNKIVAIPNPISTNQKLNDNEILNKRKVVLSVGRLSAWDKRVDRLLYIWSNVSPQFPDWTLKILGDGPEKENLQKLSLQLHLRNISFEGFVNPKSYYRDSSILCSTSSSEGFPMTFCEATQMGLCILTFNASKGVNFILQTLQNGISITPLNEDSYVKYLSMLMSNIEMRHKLAKQGLSNIHFFDIDEIGKKWKKILQK